jgi:hypothetical protein
VVGSFVKLPQAKMLSSSTDTEVLVVAKSPYKPKRDLKSQLLAVRVDSAAYEKFCAAKKGGGLQRNSELLRRALNFYLNSLEV